MNPLRQYFRRPALHLKLPSQGKFYPQNSIEMPENSELPIFPMTAIDEITSKTPDALYNGTAIVDIIKSCVPNIKDPWRIPAVDIDALLIGIKSASTGNNLDILSTCTNCNNEETFAINLLILLQNIKLGNYHEPLQIGDLKIFFKPLDYKTVNETNLMQFETQVEINNLEKIQDDKERLNKTGMTMRKVNENLFAIIAKGIDRIELPNETVTDYNFILEFILNTDKATFEEMRNYGVSLRETSEIKPVKLKCNSCANEYLQRVALNVTDFFE